MTLEFEHAPAFLARPGKYLSLNLVLTHNRQRTRHDTLLLQVFRMPRGCNAKTHVASDLSLGFSRALTSRALHDAGAATTGAFGIAACGPR
jgi:hypothetical protein